MAPVHVFGIGKRAGKGQRGNQDVDPTQQLGDVAFQGQDIGIQHHRHPCPPGPPGGCQRGRAVNAVQMQDLGLLDQPRRQLRGLQLAEGGHAGQDAALPGGPIHQHDRGLGKGAGFHKEVPGVDPVLAQLPADKVAEGVVTNLAGAGHPSTPNAPG